jgi:uncharacterized membrane protein YebE (DUF533 family)
MMGMLGKVAMGIMVAKTAGKLMGGSGGLGDMLGGLMGGNKGSSTSNNQGGMGDLLGNLMGNNSTQNNNGGLGDLLGSALAGKDVDPTPSQEEQARIILKAMINAAKSDGNMDAEEQAKITQHIGEVTPEELEFVKNEMNSELDLQGVIDSAKGIEGEVYLASLMTINLDSQEEAQYLDGLARGLGISQQAANDFHQKVGAPKLYS